MIIGVLDSGYDSYAIEESYVKDHGFELEVFQDHYGEIEDKIEFARDKIGLLIRQTEIDAHFLDQCEKLKAIVRYGIGYDNINLEEARSRNIKVANVQGYATVCVAEHAMALMFACLRALPEGQEKINSHFGKPPVTDMFEFHDKTLGIIGLGRIGSRLALNCQPLFKQVLAVDPYIDDSEFEKSGAIKTDLEQLFRESQVISIHCELNDETFHLINKKSFDLMKNKPILINTARGPVINETDLIRALHDERIHSAGIDVWEDEPLTERQQPIADHPAVVSTGHYAWYSKNSIFELQKRAAENIIGLIKGEYVADELV